jgi:hypothetical protein
MIQDRLLHFSFYPLLLSTKRGALRAPPTHPVIFLIYDEGKAPPAARQP